MAQFVGGGWGGETDLESCEWAEILMTHSASSFKGPGVGDVVTEVVDLELESIFPKFEVSNVSRNNHANT